MVQSLAPHMPHMTPQASVFNIYEDFDDFTLRALRQHVRQANLTMLPHFVRSAELHARSRETVPRLSTMLRIDAAAAARAYGRLDIAGLLLNTAYADLPPHSVDLLSALKRERVYLHLDEGDYGEARRVSQEVDCTEYERGKDDPPLFNRNERDITTETWALLAEIELLAGNMDRARISIERGVECLASGEGFRMQALLSVGHVGNRMQAQQAADLRDTLRLLEALRFLRMGQPTGYELLSELEHGLARDAQCNRQILARVQAASGSWPDSSANPPRGINIFEARRWQALASAVGGEPLYGEMVTEPQDARSILDLSSPQSEVMRSSGDGVGSEAVAMIRTITTAFLSHLQQMQQASAARLSPSPDNFAYGGRFEHFDILSMLCNAEQGKLTGFFQATWSPALVETSILAGRLHPSARLGEGYIFLKEGVIIDATIGDYNPVQAMQESAEDARHMLTALIQIGLGVGLDQMPDGSARGYPSPSIMQRRPRLQANQNTLMALLADREKQLGLIREDSGDVVTSAWG